MKFQILVSFLFVALTLAQDVPNTTPSLTDAPTNPKTASKQQPTVTSQPPTKYPTTRPPKENACQACYDKARKSGQWWVPCKSIIIIFFFFNSQSNVIIPIAGPAIKASQAHARHHVEADLTRVETFWRITNICNFHKC